MSSASAAVPVPAEGVANVVESMFVYTWESKHHQLGDLCPLANAASKGSAAGRGKRNGKWR